MVRKKVAVPLKMLLSHGLRSQKRESLALVSCATKNRQYSKGIHPWTLFLQFYKLQVNFGTKLIFEFAIIPCKWNYKNVRKLSKNSD